MVWHLFGNRPISKPMVLVNWTHGNKFHWTFNQMTTIFIHDNYVENVCKMTAVLFWLQCVEYRTLVQLMFTTRSMCKTTSHYCVVWMRLYNTQSSARWPYRPLIHHPTTIHKQQHVVDLIHCCLQKIQRKYRSTLYVLVRHMDSIRLCQKGEIT